MAAKKKTTTTKTAQKALKPVETAVQAGKQNLDAVVKAGNEAASKGYDEFALLGKDNLDALVRTNSIFAKGMEVLGKEVLSYARATLETNIAQTKALLAAKNLKEVVELHNDFARERLDKVIAETAKLTELSVQVTNEAIEPLQKRVDVTVETLLKAQAA